MYTEFTTPEYLQTGAGPPLQPGEETLYLIQPDHPHGTTTTTTTTTHLPIQHPSELIRVESTTTATDNSATGAAASPTSTLQVITNTASL